MLKEKVIFKKQDGVFCYNWGKGIVTAELGNYIEVTFDKNGKSHTVIYTNDGRLHRESSICLVKTTGQIESTMRKLEATDELVFMRFDSVVNDNICNKMLYGIAKDLAPKLPNGMYKVSVIVGKDGIPDND